MIDTRESLETPEHIDLQLTIAGPQARILAFSLDQIIKFVVMSILVYVLTFADQVGNAIYLILYFFMEWFYPVLFEVLNKGQTPGKSALNIKVINDNGTPIGWSPSIIRNLLRVADFLPMGYLLGLGIMASNSHFKRLGDYAASTLVVYQPQTTRKPQAPSQHGDSLPPPKALTEDEQRAFLNFSERLDQLSEPRREEIVTHIAPLLESQGKDAVTKVVKIANWLKGIR